eukprot:m.134399 g.134399  ORF g.134399 m.134399 type:complete len:388 (-) comp15820_c0_seq2:89-1252(-)
MSYHGTATKNCHSPTRRVRFSIVKSKTGFGKAAFEVELFVLVPCRLFSPSAEYTPSLFFSRASSSGVHDGVLANIMSVFGLSRDLASALPRPTIDKSKPGLRSQFFVTSIRGSKSPARLNIIVGRDDVPLPLSGISNHADTQPMTFALVRHPVNRFVDLWEELQMAQRLGGITMKEYLQEPRQFSDKIPRELQLRLHNGMARSLGYTGEALVVPTAEARVAVNRISPYITQGLIAEHWFESLIYFRRLMCWSKADISYIAHSSNVNVPPGATVDTMFPVHKVDKELEALIINANSVDFALYTAFNTTLWRKLDREMSVKAEIDGMKQHLQGLLDKCHDLISLSQAELLQYVKTGSKMEPTCARMLLAHESVEQLIKDKKSTRWTYSD